MSTLPWRSAPVLPADGHREPLRRHLDTALAELWAESPTPVWVADDVGRIVYTNPAAYRAFNGTGVQQAAERIAQVAAERPIRVARAEAESPMIDVSPLADAAGRRVGWLAIGAAS